MPVSRSCTHETMMLGSHEAACSASASDIMPDSTCAGWWCSASLEVLDWRAKRGVLLWKPLDPPFVRRLLRSPCSSISRLLYALTLSQAAGSVQGPHWVLHHCSKFTVKSQLLIVWRAAGGVGVQARPGLDLPQGHRPALCRHGLLLGGLLTRGKAAIRWAALLRKQVTGVAALQL